MTYNVSSGTLSLYTTTSVLYSDTFYLFSCAINLGLVCKFVMLCQIG